MTDNNENNNLNATAASEDDNNTATAKKEENNAAASDNSASINEAKNTAKTEAASTTENQEESNDTGNNNTTTLTNDNTFTAQKEENNSLEQARQTAIQEVEKAWKEANLSSSEDDVLGKDWKKEFENEDLNAINNRKKSLIQQITKAKKEQETQSSQQLSSPSEENRQSKNNEKTDNSPSTHESGNKKPNQPTTNENSPTEKSQDIEKVIIEVQTQNSNGENWNPEVFSKEEIKQTVTNQKINSTTEAKEIQKALTLAEKALTSKEFQPNLSTKLHAVKDGEPIIYRATKTQIDRAIQHLQQLQKQENTTDKQKQNVRQENEKNGLTTGQKLAIGVGIFGGVILVGLIISSIRSKKRER